MTFIDALHNPACYDHPVTTIELIETHISWVLLTGDYAYKIKKPLDLGFLDFTSLEKRLFFCQEELRINRRLAPQLYLDVVPITGTPEQPRVGRNPPRPPLIKGGDLFEYAVKMKQFPQADRLDHVLARGELRLEHMDQLARQLVDCYDSTPPVGAESPWGDPDVAFEPVQECFDQLHDLVSSEQRAILQELEQWCRQEFSVRREQMQQRKLAGRIREGHGDVHLANIVLLEGIPTLFDAIEFSEKLRFIDNMNEVAFLLMDLMDRKAAAFGFRFLNTYLAWSGDYAGLQLLRFYCVYRALVRAKVTSIRCHQAGLQAAEQAQLSEDVSHYLKLGQHFTRPGTPRLIMMRGPSGAGKTHVAQELAGELQALHLRTDVERKRHFNLRLDQSSSESLKDAMYSHASTQWSYQWLADLAEPLLQAGYSVIVDGTFLKREQRQVFQGLAGRCHVPLLIIDFQIPKKLLEQRMLARQQTGGDASEADRAVLAAQLEAEEPLRADEIGQIIPVTEGGPGVPELVQQITGEHHVSQSP